MNFKYVFDFFLFTFCVVRRQPKSNGPILTRFHHKKREKNTKYHFVTTTTTTTKTHNPCVCECRHVLAALPRYTRFERRRLMVHHFLYMYKNTSILPPSTSFSIQSNRLYLLKTKTTSRKTIQIIKQNHKLLSVTVDQQLRASK